MKIFEELIFGGFAVLMSAVKRPNMSSKLHREVVERDHDLLCEGDPQRTCLLQPWVVPAVAPPILVCSTRILSAPTFRAYLFFKVKKKESKSKTGFQKIK